MRFAGLVNLGNTCFMNAVLQALVPFREVFEHESVEEGSLTESLSSVLSRLVTDNEPEDATSPVPPVIPARFLFDFVRAFPYFKGFEQHDAFEFLQLLMDHMHSEGSEDSTASADAAPPATITSLVGPQLLQMSREALKASARSDTNPISTHFMGQQLNVAKCYNCSVMTAKFTPHTVVSLPIVNSTSGDVPVSSIENCFDLYFATNPLLKEDQLFCSTCNSKQDGAMKNLLTINPKVLIVHFKRFTFSDGAARKLDHRIAFDLELILPDLEQTVNGTDLIRYELQSVVYHVGSMSDGHYVAMSKRGDDWYFFNDADEPEKLDKVYNVVDEAAYILFYRKVEFAILSEDQPATP